MFNNSQMGGTNTAFPDVCKTPTPAGPIPLPYPNISEGMTAIPTQFSVLYEFMPGHNYVTETPLSQGDDAGVAGGAVSQMDMSTSKQLLCSTGVLISVMPATRMTDMTGQNGVMPNSVGATLVPAQVKVLTLR